MTASERIREARTARDEYLAARSSLEATVRRIRISRVVDALEAKFTTPRKG